jgi:uncharacterized protein (TIGR02246 family)
MTTNSADAAVRAVLERVYVAWAKNDADAFVEPYNEAATAILPGTFLANRAAIHATMKALFAGLLAGSRAVYEVQSIRWPGTDVALVSSKGAIVRAGQMQPDEATRSFETWVLSKQGAEWQVLAFHNCPAVSGGSDGK